MNRNIFIIAILCIAIIVLSGQLSCKKSSSNDDDNDDNTYGDSYCSELRKVGEEECSIACGNIVSCNSAPGMGGLQNITMDECKKLCFDGFHYRPFCASCLVSCWTDFTDCAVSVKCSSFCVNDECNEDFSDDDTAGNPQDDDFYDDDTYPMDDDC